MDRQVTHTGALIPNATLLGGEKAKLISLGYALESILGSSTTVAGLACTPTTPASLSVVIGPGSITTKEAIDTAAFGDLGTDGNATVKQGILQEPGTTLALTPPAASGYSQVYLIQAKRSDVDSGTVIPYYNAANPSQPFNGPANSGNEDLTLRASVCTIALKPGIAAPTGSQLTPTPDSGYVGLYTITLVNGQTQVISANIAVYQGAPFIPVTLPSVPAAVQAGQWLYGVDQGASGTLLAALAPTPTALPDGMKIHVRAANAAAGADTINVSGLGALPIRRWGGKIPAVGDWSAGDVLTLMKVGSTWQLASLVASDVVGLIQTYAPVVPTGDVTIHVSTSGVDATADGTTTKPFRTVVAALSYASKRFFFAGYNLFINLDVAGSYDAPGVVPPIGGSVTIQGSTTNQTAFVLQGAGPGGGNVGVITVNSGQLNLKGVTVSNTGTINHNICASSGGTIFIQNVTFTTNNQIAYALVFASAGGSVIVQSGCVMAGGAAWMWYALSGYITMGAVVNVSGPLVFSIATVAVNGPGLIVVATSGLSFNVTGTITAKRYSLTIGGATNVGVDPNTFFPGTAAGVNDGTGIAA